MSSGGEQVKKRASKGSGALSTKTNGSYEYRIRYTDVFGQHRTKSFSGKTVDECLDRADEFREKIRKLKVEFNIDVTIPEILC